MTWPTVLPHGPGREHYHLVARPSVTLVADPGGARVATCASRRTSVDVAGEPLPEPMPAEASEHTDGPRPSRATSRRRRFRVPRIPAGAHRLERRASASTSGGALISIGRASDNDVIVDDPEVSRHHCQLKLQHGAYSLADLGSRNGSWINGQPVSEVALGPAT
jgi:hypothetical protein